MFFPATPDQLQQHGLFRGKVKSFIATQVVKISRECNKSGPWQHQQIKWINVWDQEIQQEEDIWRRNAKATDHLNVSCGKATSSVLFFSK